MDVFSRLKNSIDVLKNSDPADAYPGADPVYDNDLHKWVRFANSFRFRLAMRVRFVDPDLSRRVIEEVMKEEMIEENSQTFILTHSDSNNSYLYNQWYNVRCHANFQMSEKCDKKLKEINNPRLEILV